MSPRVILVSGANKGIGLEAVKLLSAEHPQDVILMGSRDVKNGEEAIKKHQLTNVKVIQLDVTNQSSIDDAVKQIEQQYGYLNVLVNNSGISTMDPSRKAGEGVMDVNVYGLQRMHDAFLPLLLKSNNQSKPTIVVVSSEVGSWFTHTTQDESLKKFLLAPEQWTKDTPKELINDYLATIDKSSSKYTWKLPEDSPMNQWKSYGASKAIATPYCRWYASQHPEVQLAIVCPGYCATDLNHFQGYRTAAQGGQSIIWPITNKFETGRFYQDGKEHAFTSAPQIPQ
jgi:NAD(P)-dependent dehydrogenase (short-subunit alcohol dehydrogenase family)